MRRIDLWAGVPLCYAVTLVDRLLRAIGVRGRGHGQRPRHILFIQLAEMGTMVHDRVLYRLLGPDVLTRVVNTLLVAPDTRRIFAFRHAALEQCLNLTGQTRSGPVTIARRRA